MNPSLPVLDRGTQVARNNGHLYFEAVTDAGRHDDTGCSLVIGAAVP